MNNEHQETKSTVTAKIEFGAGEWRFQTKVTIPTEPIRLRQMLPLVRSLSETMIGAVTQDLAQQGHHVSCKKGCGACCRQMVPVSGVEARYLADMVDALPEPRRTEIRARFAAALERLAESGLLEKMRHNQQWTDDDYQALGADYFRLAMPCPFLEEESCSIHPERPVSCREFLVTSPAEHCAKVRDENVQPIRFPFKMWWALARFDPLPADVRYVPWVPLILALEWAKNHPDEEAARPGPELVSQLFEKLAGKEVPPPTAF